MFQFFLLCAVVAGTIFLVQFVLTMLGVLGDADLDLDVPDADIDFDGGDFDGGADFGAADGGPAMDTSIDTPADSATGQLFRMISLRTLVAGVLFFGLGGMLALDNGAPPWLALAIGAVCGGGAFYAVYWVFRLIYGMGEDHTARIHDALGAGGTVYVPIPPGGEGVGKVQLRMAGRIIEMAARSSVDYQLPTGTRIQVTKLAGPTTVVVRPTDPAAIAGGAEISENPQS